MTNLVLLLYEINNFGHFDCLYSFVDYSQKNYHVYMKLEVLAE